MTTRERLMSILFLILGVAQAKLNGEKWEPCPIYYNMESCTACPANLYQTCPAGHKEVGEQGGCGFLSAGCKMRCKDPAGKGYNQGCGCGKGTGCLLCKMGGWQPWEACDRSCGGGTQKRHRSVLHDNWNPQTCPHGEEKRSCNTHCCKTNCVTVWGEWSACSKTCGDDRGTQTRKRSVTQSACGGGKACPTDNSETRTCPPTPCPVDCVLSEWSEFGECIGPFGACVTLGKKTRTRTVATEQVGNGKACEGALTEEAACTTMDCEPCTWVEHNNNTKGEKYIGDADSREECIKLVRNGCEGATIANIKKNGKQCWCQWGMDMTPDDDAGYMNCLLVEAPGPAPTVSPTWEPTEATESPTWEPTGATESPTSSSTQRCPPEDPSVGGTLKAEKVAQRKFKEPVCHHHENGEECRKRPYCIWKNKQQGAVCRDDKTRNATELTKSFLKYMQCACSKFCEKEYSEQPQMDEPIAFWELHVKEADVTKLFDKTNKKKLVKGRCYCKTGKGKRKERDHAYLGGLLG